MSCTLAGVSSLAASRDPELDEIDFLRLEWIGIPRHQRLLAGDVIENETFIRLAGGEPRAVLATLLEVFKGRDNKLAAVLRGLMTAGAVPLQDRGAPADSS